MGCIRQKACIETDSGAHCGRSPQLWALQACSQTTTVKQQSLQTIEETFGCKCTHDMECMWEQLFWTPMSLPNY